MSRLPALEAVAEALAAVNEALAIDADVTVKGDEVKAYVPAEDGGRVKTYFGASECRKLSAAFAHLAARLDATPAAQSPTPADEELRRLYSTAYRSDGWKDRTGDESDAIAMRAIHDHGIEAGRAECVARLREMAATEGMTATGADALSLAADALESER